VGKFFDNYHKLIPPYGIFPDFPNLTAFFGVTWSKKGGAKKEKRGARSLLE